MIIDIDIGNTRVKWRVRDGADVIARGAQETDTLIDGAALQLDDVPRLCAARICSVADLCVGQNIQRQLHTRDDIEARFAQVSRRAGGVECGYATVEALGTDRWLAMLAGFQRIGGATLVVDAGSALTLDIVSLEGRHLGGYIVAGQRLMRGALWRGTHAVKVASTPVGNLLVPPTNTLDAVGNGGLLSATAMIEKLAGQHGAAIVMTGGDGRLLAAHLDVPALCVDDLVLEGLAVAGVVWQ